MADNYEIEVTLEETFGTGIRSVEQTGSSSASGGLNEITVTLTNDQQNKFYIMNGLKGEDGKDGRDGSSPIAVTTAEQMTDHSQIYLYGGNEEGYTARHLYYWNGSEWADYGLYGMPDTYLSTASIENETELDQHGNTVSTSTTLGITGRILSNPAYYELVQKLYSVSGENEDGALTQKATSEAIDAAQFLPILNHPIAPVGDNYLSASLVPNVLNVLNGVGYTFTEVNLTLSGAKENTLTRWFVRFTTGGNAVTDFDFPGTVTVPSGFSLKTQTTYDIVIENGVAHIWEDGNAVGNVLDAEATADAVADWLDDHPEATTTVADGSITTAKLASGVIDNTLLVSGAAADSKKVGDEISDLKSQIGDTSELETEATDLVSAINEVRSEGGGDSGLTSDIKLALLQLAQKVAYIDANGQDYYDDLYDALYPPIPATAISLSTNSISWTTTGQTQQLTATLTPSTSTDTVTWASSDTSVATVSSSGLVTGVALGSATITATASSVSATCSVVIATATLSSISAVYTQSGTVYDTDSLDSLKSDLVVTATWSDSSTTTVASADYTLSGTLTVGTSTITVSYGGQTTTFTVTVSSDLPSVYTWLYKASDGELLSEKTAYVTETVTGTATETLSNGDLVLNSATRSDNNSNFLKYAITDTTTTNGKLSCKAKIVNTLTSYNTPMGFRLALSNGTTGAKAFFIDKGNTGMITVVYVEGTTNKEVETNKSKDDYHIFELSLVNGHQILEIDGDEIFDSTTLASSTTNSAIFNQAGKSTVNPNGVKTNIKWVAYYEQ